jgi:AcrR family transcriptional regulator
MGVFHSQNSCCVNTIAHVPRPQGDHDTRRREVAEAVLRVLATRGFAQLTMRAVAAELGASTGIVTHYFATKDELRTFALDVLARSVDERQPTTAPPGLPALRALVLGMLPLTAEGATANRIWISSWDVVLAAPDLTATYAETYAQSRARVERAVRIAQEAGELGDADPGELAAALHAFTLGLAVQAVLDPAAFPPARQIAMTDAYLRTLTPSRPTNA